MERVYERRSGSLGAPFRPGHSVRIDFAILTLLSRSRFNSVLHTFIFQSSFLLTWWVFLVRYGVEGSGVIPS